MKWCCFQVQQLLYMVMIKVRLSYSLSYPHLSHSQLRNDVSYQHKLLLPGNHANIQRIPNCWHYCLGILPRLCTRSSYSLLARRQRRTQTLHLHLPSNNFTRQPPHVHIRPFNEWYFTLERRSTRLHASRTSSHWFGCRRHRRRDSCLQL